MTLEQLFLCAVWNTFVLDWLLRTKVTTTVNFFYVYQLPVPRLTRGDRYFDALVERAARLICTTPEFDELAREVGLAGHQQGVTDDVERAQLRAEIDGLVAHLYGLDKEELSHVLSTFPLVPQSTKDTVLDAYRQLLPPTPVETLHATSA